MDRVLPCRICGRVARLQSCNRCGSAVCQRCITPSGVCLSCARGFQKDGLL